MAWWWLSFADDEGFRGGINVQGDDFLGAVLNAKLMGQNPGGQVRGLELTFDISDLPEKYKNRLLSLDDIAEMDRAMGESGEPLKWDEAFPEGGG